MMKKVFIDTDVILDLFGRREPFYRYSAELFTLVDAGRVKGYVSPVIVANLHYILCRLQNRKLAVINLQKLMALVNILSVNEKIIKLALASDFKDFEDAIQYYTAVENNLKYLITRNKKDYRSAEITILSAEEYLNLYKQYK
ncbi:MAG TPA: PIN domain-containing protein [Spirochaetota bacterium]|nr:PIN domain-containing protein [Spirochaetota bacterium]